MNLSALLNRRRYRRLSLALLAALTAHLAIVVTGTWSILLFSTPSNQNRLLTLTLENTSYEGLKETSKEDDTINDAKLGQASDSHAPEPNSEKPKPRPTQEPQPALAQQTQLDKEPQPAREPQPEKVKTQVTPKPIDHKPLPNQPPLQNQLSPIDNSKLVELTKSSALESPQGLLRASKTLLDIIASNNLSPIKISKPTLSNKADQISKAEPQAKFDVDEAKMLNKKIKVWSSSISKGVEFSEPLKWQDNGRQYEASFKKHPAENNMKTDEIVIDIATERDGKSVTTTLRLKKMAFSNFAQFVHRWDDNVSIHNDEVDGRFHTNTKINLLANRQGAPVFRGKVTTASYFINIDSNIPRSKIFLAGLETGVKRITMPKPKVLFNKILADTAVNSRVIEKNSRIIFRPDGSYLVQAFKEIGVMQRYEIGNEPLYLLAAPKVALSISGIVNGTVAVYSPKKIIIEGNLEYLSVENVDDGGDFLGLISDRSISVAGRKTAPKGDLTIHAAIYAKNRFEVRQISGKNAGTLNIFGSVSAGSITATEPRYATNIIFDTRLEHLKPPGFPVTERYEVLAKQNGWQLEDEPFYETLEENDFENESAATDTL